jgi:hypothetical protein
LIVLAVLLIALLIVMYLAFKYAVDHKDTAAERIVLDRGLLAIALALFSLFVSFTLESFKGEQQIAVSAQAALQTYRYDARRRLYADCEPLFFELSESTAFALQTCSDLARPDICSKLRPERNNSHSGGPWMLNRSSEIVAILYALYYPLALWRLLKERLTLVDCSVDEGVHFRYKLARQLYSTFHQDVVLASVHPALPYDPRVQNWRTMRIEDPATYWWQGLTPGRLDRAVDAFLIGDGAAKRVLTFGEFEDLYQKTFESDSSQQKILGLAANPLYGFTPFERPVFWRLILVQAHLHHGLSRPVPPQPLRVLETREQLEEFLGLDDYSRFDWRRFRWDGIGDRNLVDDAKGIALRFLAEQLVVTPLSRVSERRRSDE